MSDPFFDYTAGQQGPPDFLGDRSEDDWAALFEHTEVRRFVPGDQVIRKGATDRSLDLLLVGTLRAIGGRGAARDFVAPTVVGEVAFFDGGARTKTLVAVTEGEIRRLTPAGFEALSARRPDLARAILLDLGRVIARRLRAADELLGEDIG